jgi:ligand-binding sensor domain-containing protein/signal transduction histidine kinase
MPKIFKFNIFLWLFLCQYYLYAQSTKYRIEHIGIKQGLSQGSVYTMLKDRKGYMWFGTQDGLNKWDGQKMKIFKGAYQQINKWDIDGIEIKKIYEDINENLWVGTESALNKYNYEDETFKKYRFKDLKGKIIKAEHFPIYADANKVLVWISTLGLLEYTFKSKLQKIIFKSSSFSTSYFNYINSSIYDNNELWIDTKLGIINLNIKSKKIKYYFSKHKYNIVGKPLNVIKLLKKGNELFIATNNSLVNFNLKNNQIKEWTEFESGKSIGNIFDIAIDKNNQIWIGSERNGILILNPKSNNFEQIKSNEKNANFSLYVNEISQIYIDDDGIVWANTDPFGIDKIRILPDNFNVFKLPLEDRLNTDLLNPSVRFLLEDQNMLWLGTQQSGVWRLNKNDFSIIDGFYNQNQKNIPSNTIRFMLKDSQNKVWLGTSEGLAYFDNNKFKEVVAKNFSTEQKFVRVIEEFGNHLFIGTESGVLKVNKKAGKYESFQIFKNKRISLLKIISDYELLVGVYNEGLYLLNSKDGFLTFQTSKILDGTIPISCKVQNDIWWIGTSRGILKYQYKTKKKDWITQKNGLPNEFIYGLELDKKGNLWVSTNKGIAKYDTAINQVFVFNINDGLQDLEYNGYSSMLSSEGILYFGGINGLNYFDPDKIFTVDNSYRNVLKNDLEHLIVTNTSFLDVKNEFQKPDVSDTVFNAKFKSDFEAIANFKYTEYPCWVKIPIRNSSNASWFLEVDNARLDDLEIWVYERNQLVFNKKAGNFLPKFLNETKEANPIFRLEMIENQDYVIYLKAYTLRDLKVKVNFWESSSLLNYLVSKKLIWGIFIGFIILISLYNIILWITIKDNTYLFYTLYILFFGAFQLSLYGYGYQYLWHNSRFNTNGFLVFLLLSNIFLILFTEHFLNLKTWFSGWFIYFKSIYFIISLSLISLSFFYFQYYYNYIIIILGIILNFIFWTICYQYWVKRIKLIYYYFIATYFMAMASGIVSLQNLGILNAQNQEYIFMIGSMCEIVLFSFALGYKFRKNLLEKEQQQALRIEIASNLHDDLAASLSSLTMFTELKKMKTQDLPQKEVLANIAIKTRIILSKIREAVYELNPQNDEEEDWIERFLTFGQEITNSTEISFFSDIESTLDFSSISPNARRQIFLIFKEALNNAAKYSECSNLFFTIKKVDHAIEFRLNDDGVGFNIPKENKKGNGLNNMAIRAQKIKAFISISSNIGTGTEVLLRI